MLLPFQGANALGGRVSQGAAPLALGYALLGFQLVADSGCFEVTLDDGRRHGRERRVVTLNHPFQGLHVPPGVWAGEWRLLLGKHLLGPRPYCEGDYMRFCDDFLRYVGVRG